MSNSNGHLSASERKILALQQRIAEFEVMREEYALLLNHLVRSNGGQYIFHSEDAKKVIPPKIVRSVRRFATAQEIADGVPPGPLMIITLCEPETPSPIIRPS